MVEKTAGLALPVKLYAEVPPIFRKDLGAVDIEAWPHEIGIWRRVDGKPLKVEIGDNRLNAESGKRVLGAKRPVIVPDVDCRDIVDVDLDKSTPAGDVKIAKESVSGDKVAAVIGGI